MLKEFKPNFDRHKLHGEICILRNEEPERDAYARATEILDSYSKPEKKNILEKANELINGDRQQDYAHPLDNFGRISAMWTAILKDKLKDGESISEEEHILCMLAVKIARLIHTPEHKDSIIDIAGYAGTYEMVMEERERRNNPLVSVSESEYKLHTDYNIT